MHPSSQKILFIMCGPASSIQRMVHASIKMGLPIKLSTIIIKKNSTQAYLPGFLTNIKLMIRFIASCTPDQTTTRSDTNETAWNKKKWID